MSRRRIEAELRKNMCNGCYSESGRRKIVEKRGERINSMNRRCVQLGRVSPFREECELGSLVAAMDEQLHLQATNKNDERYRTTPEHKITVIPNTMKQWQG